MQIFIDADGCPVVDITIETAQKYNLPVTVVCDTSHFFLSDYAKIITVDKGADSADFKLANLIGKDDIAITQDHGLAAMCLAKNAYVLNQDGLIYNNDNIDAMLFSRYTAKKIRNSGGRLKGPKKRCKFQNDNFKSALEKIIKGEN